MIIMQKRYFKNFIQAVLIVATIFIFSQVTTTYAAAASTIGVVDYKLLVQQHPDMAQAQKAYNAVIKQARDEFNAKKDNMNDEDQKVLYQQLQKEIQEKQQEIVKPIRDKVDAAIKEVADSKGLATVVDKSSVVYGGQDITDDVMKKITGN